MKTHAIKEGKSLGFFDATHVVLVLSLVFYTVLSSVISSPFPVYFGKLAASIRNDFSSTNRNVYNNGMTETKKIDENVSVPVPASVSPVDAKLHSEPLSTVSEYADEYAVPAVERVLLLEAWMTDDSFWTPAKDAAGELPSEPEEEELHAVAEPSAAPVVVFTPEVIAEYLVIESEPPLVFESWIGSWLHLKVENPVTADDLSSVAWASWLVDPDFDCRAYLLGLARIKEAMIDEIEPPLTLEPWMTDETFFPPVIKD